MSYNYGHDILNAVSERNDLKICIFGAGDYGMRMYHMLKVCKIKAAMFSDNNPLKWDTKVVDEVKCFNPKSLLDDTKLRVIVAVKNNQDVIADDLRNRGFDKIVLMSEIEEEINERIDEIINGYGVDLVKYMSVTGRGTDKCLENDCFPMPVHFYQPVPNIKDLERRNIWDKVSGLDGVVWEPNKYLANLSELSAYQPKQSWPRQQTDDAMEFNLDNTSFSYMCASALYGMIRKYRPKRIVEIGSGNSSKVIRQALLDNSSDDENCEFNYTIIDPYCAFDEQMFTGGGINATTLKIPVEESGIGLFKELEENDILFIDSSHTVCIGGDVNFEILEVLPVLANGVIVHFHDISLPYEYPKIYATNPAFRVFWTESYLLQAFLAFNNQFEILLPVQHLCTKHFDEVRKLYPQMLVPFDWSSASMWIRRK
ncbi:hypothetical protein AGMMS49938_05780 [Fibrobacterales bacterium]|nr:hypothetical protein AGMMS49938_05780 [Fibrobacterales bacterium]